MNGVGAVALDRFAERFATTAIDNIHCRYPQRLDGVITASHGYPEPAATHPAFHGSFDWHSCVHMQWLLVRLLSMPGSAVWRDEAIRTLDSRLCDSHVATECEFMLRPENAVFERPYGWAWILKLQTELKTRTIARPDPHLRQWTRALGPLATLLAERYRQYLATAAYPVRAGTHANSAFAMMMALDFATSENDAALYQLIRSRATDWFENDHVYPAAYEPDGEDFLSGGLLEAALMARLLDRTTFNRWWQQFRPDPAGLRQWRTPVSSIARDDAKIVHLDGLNLSRAWCWRLLAEALPPPEAEQANQAAQAHLQVSLPHVTSGTYAGDHWLASFATLALTVTQQAN